MNSVERLSAGRLLMFSKLLPVFSLNDSNATVAFVPSSDKKRSRLEIRDMLKVIRFLPGITILPGYEG